LPVFYLRNCPNSYLQTTRLTAIRVTTRQCRRRSQQLLLKLSRHPVIIACSIAMHPAAQVTNKYSGGNSRIAGNRHTAHHH